MSGLVLGLRDLQCGSVLCFGDLQRYLVLRFGGVQRRLALPARRVRADPRRDERANERDHGDEGGVGNARQDCHRSIVSVPPAEKCDPGSDWVHPRKEPSLLGGSATGSV
jgi:hypothetical protein